MSNLIIGQLVSITTTDSHSLCPNPGVTQGAKLEINGREFVATTATKGQVFFKGQGFAVPGASKGSPVELQVKLISEGNGQMAFFGGVQASNAPKQVKTVAEANPKIAAAKRLVELYGQLGNEEKKNEAAAHLELLVEEEKKAAAAKLEAEIAEAMKAAGLE